MGGSVELGAQLTDAPEMVRHQPPESNEAGMVAPVLAHHEQGRRTPRARYEVSRLIKVGCHGFFAQHGDTSFQAAPSDLKVGFGSGHVHDEVR